MQVPRLQSLLPAALLCMATLALPAAATDEPRVAVERTEPESVIREASFSGTVTTPRDAAVSTAIGGLVEEVVVDAGSRVEPGDILVKLDAELEQLALERARAAMQESRSLLDDAERRLDEAEQLGRDQSIAATEIEARRAEAATSRAALQASRAALRQQEAVVRRHVIRAPFAGVIRERLADAGEWVNPGDTLLELVATDGLRLDFQVPQDFFPHLDKDTRVTVRLDALPDRPFEGRVQAVVPVSDPGARTFLLRVVIAKGNESSHMTPGMSAQATVHIDTGREAVVVPRDALLRHPDGRTTVWVIDDEDNRARERLVDTGLEFNGKVEIRSGLEAGVRVVTRGNESLQDGQSVRSP